MGRHAVPRPDRDSFIERDVKRKKPRFRVPDRLRKMIRSGEDIVFNDGSRVVMIGVPMYRFTHPRTVISINNLVNNFVKQAIGAIALRYVTSTWIPIARNKLMLACEREGAEGILFVDDDMSFHSGGGEQPGDPGFNPLVRLMERDVDICAAMCSNRSMPPSIMCGWEKPDGMVNLVNDSDMISPRNRTPFQVDYTGFGFIYIRSTAIKKIRDYLGTDDPHFFNIESNWHFQDESREMVAEALRSIQDGEDPDAAAESIMQKINHQIRRSTFLGEDYSFCRKAREAGCEIWVDPSFEVRHHGDYPYTRLDWLAYREGMMEAGDEQAEQRKLALGG